LFGFADKATAGIHFFRICKADIITFSAVLETHSLQENIQFFYNIIPLTLLYIIFLKIANSY